MNTEANPSLLTVPEVAARLSVTEAADPPRSPHGGLEGEASLHPLLPPAPPRPASSDGTQPDFWPRWEDRADFEVRLNVEHTAKMRDELGRAATAITATTSSAATSIGISKSLLEAGAALVHAKN